MRLEFTEEQKKRISKMINNSYWGVSISGFKTEHGLKLMRYIQRSRHKTVIEFMVDRVNDAGYFSSKEMAHILGVSEPYVWVLLKKKKLKAIKFGKRLYFCKLDYERKSNYPRTITRSAKDI